MQPGIRFTRSVILLVSVHPWSFAVMAVTSMLRFCMESNLPLGTERVAAALLGGLLANVKLYERHTVTLSGIVPSADEDRRQ